MDLPILRCDECGAVAYQRPEGWVAPDGPALEGRIESLEQALEEVRRESDFWQREHSKVLEKLLYLERLDAEERRAERTSVSDTSPSSEV